MRFKITGILLLSAVVLTSSAAAQTTPAPSAITRTVIAATKLPTVTDVPLYFRAVGVTLAPGEKSSVAAANGILYQISGSTEVSVGGEAKVLSAGEGLFIAGGKTAALKAGSGEPSTFLHFFLAPVADLDRPVETAPAAVRELYRTAAPIPGPGTLHARRAHCRAGQSSVRRSYCNSSADQDDHITNWLTANPPVSTLHSTAKV